MYTIGRKWHRIETVGRKPLSKPEPYIGCSALEEEEYFNCKILSAFCRFVIYNYQPKHEYEKREIEIENVNLSSDHFLVSH